MAISSLDALEREINRQRRALRGIENAAARDLRRTYLMIYRRLRAKLEALQAEIENLRALGVDVNTSRLVNLQQYRELIQDLEAEVWSYGRQAAEVIAESQRAALAGVNADQKRLTEISSGAPASLQAEVGTRLISLSPSAIDQYVGFAAKGMPLGDLLSSIAPAVRQEAQDVIAYGIARGQSPRVVATAFRQVTAVPLDRALTISRTEMLRAYRSAATDFYKANATALQGWIWHAQLDDRTCPACAAMNGTKHELDEPFGAHVNCRCSQIPYTKSWKELGFDNMGQYERPDFLSPDEAFGRLPQATQRQILGPTRYEMYKAGKLSLKDNVRVTDSKRWGKSHVTRPIKSLAHAA